MPRITVTDRYDITVAAAPGTSLQWTLDTISGDAVGAIGGGWWPDSDPHPLNPLTGAAGLSSLDEPIGGAIVVPDGALGARIILNSQDPDFNVGTSVADVTLGDWAPVVPVDPRPAYVWSGSEWVPIGGGAGSSGGVPVGTVVAWAGQPTAVPRGWLLCDGQAVPASSALAGMLSHVPDLRARFVMGAHPGSFEALTSGGSRKITVEQMPSHGHGLHGANTGETKTVTNTGNDWGVFIPAQSWTYPEAIEHTGGGQDYLPPYYALAYIIRSELTADDIADLTTLDARYVNVNGDSMTGPLVVKPSAGEHKTTLTSTGAIIDRSNTAGSGPSLTFRKTRSADDSHTVVASGDILGNLAFQGSDGAAYRQAAAIRGAVTGTPAAGDVRGVLTFACRDSDDGPDAPSVKMRVDGTAITANVPVILPADPAAAMHAATKQYVDARAGSAVLTPFTPVVRQGTTATAPIALTATYAKTQRVGGLIQVVMRVDFTANGPGGDNIYVELPVPPANGQAGLVVGTGVYWRRNPQLMIPALVRLTGDPLQAYLIHSAFSWANGAGVSTAGPNGDTLHASAFTVTATDYMTLKFEYEPAP